MASHIAGCIESVLSQDISVEHIIVDGGSEDGTLELIGKLKHPDLTLINESDNGQSDAINKGLRLANGEIFNWLNADDRLKPNCLDEVVNLMKPGVSAVLGKCEHVNADSGHLEITGQTYFDGSIGSSMANYGMAQPSHFYRTEQIQTLGGVNANLHYVMDMDLWFRYLLMFGKDEIVRSNSLLSEFWLFKESKSTALAGAMTEEKYAIFLSIINKLNAPRPLLEMTKKKASELRLDYQVEGINSTEFISTFSWHLLLEAYANGDLELASLLLNLVNQGGRLTATEKASWKLRVSGTSGQLLKKLRGK
jgi:glycosyltransferase involved in cell wall biosynthesis